MSTPSQITANQRNAQSSTGPRTPEGKSRSARNSTKLGLFTTHDLVRPEEEAEYRELTAALWHDLLPDGALQQSLAIRIIRATWRLERCARVEESLLDSMLETGLDPMQNEATLKTQNAVDRARASSENTIRRATNELRRIQTDRQITSETFHKKEIPHIGLTSMKEVVVSLQNQNKVKLLLRKIQGQDDFAEVMAPPDPAFFEFFNTHFAAKQTQPAAA